MARELDYALTLVRVFVADLDRAARFYTETLGMPLVQREDEAGWAQQRQEERRAGDGRKSARKRHALHVLSSRFGWEILLIAR